MGFESEVKREKVEIMRDPIKPNVPAVPKPDLPKSLSTQDYITYLIQELIANVVDALKHYAFSISARYEDMEMDPYVLPILLGIISGSIIAIVTHKFAERMKAARNGA